MTQLAQLDLTQPRQLATVAIPKPWGQEIWYTGMETRGESAIVVDHTLLPLSNYLALDPRATCAEHDVLLLKVLDPSPAPVIGDLYFEVHREKREVYVVTHIDADAWPNGEGAIRFGMSQTKRSTYASDIDFRTAYLEAVNAYEDIRRKIDTDTKQLEAQEHLEKREHDARQVMESFTALRPLQVGDVVAIPPGTPHSLQHGVRAVEFQTPTYERLIISFAQQVVTQDHWDSEEAVAYLSLDPPTDPVFEAISAGISRIARFPDFNVWRVHNLSALSLPAHLPYAVCFVVEGEARFNNLNLSTEDACFVPKLGIEQTIIQADNATLLIAAPEL